MLRFPTMNFSAARMLDARLAANLSRGDLAHRVRTISGDAIKADSSTIRRWEKGLNEPGASAVGCIAKATGKDIEFFYESGGDDELDEEAALQSARLVPEALVERIVEKRVQQRLRELGVS